MAKTLLVVAAMISLLPGPGIANDDWTLLRDQQGIQVYSQPVAGSNYHRVRAITHTSASLQRTLSVLQDHPLRPQWDAACKEARLHQQLDDGSELLYYVIGMPWPFSDRDVVVNTEVSATAKQVVVMSRAVNDILPPHENRVRLTQSDVRWTITDLGPRGRQIELISHSEPGATLPASLVNRLLDSLPWRSLHGLRSLLEST